LAGALQLLGKPAECLLLVIHGNKESVVMLRDADAARWQRLANGVPAAIAVPRKTGCKKWMTGGGKKRRSLYSTPQNANT
jgi:hypothetical protein